MLARDQYRFLGGEECGHAIWLLQEFCVALIAGASLRGHSLGLAVSGNIVGNLPARHYIALHSLEMAGERGEMAVKGERKVGGLLGLLLVLQAAP